MRPVASEAASRTFRLDGGDSTYVLGVNNLGQVQSVYWGRKLAPGDEFPAPHSVPGRASFDPSVNATPQEFVGWGGGLYVVPNLKIMFPDGNRDLVLRYVSNTADGPELKLVMKDIEREVYVTLSYRMDPATGILERAATVENKTNKPFTIEEAASATWNLQAADDYQLNYLTGEWAGEGNLQQAPMHPGKTILESRRGSTGHQNSPWFAIQRGESGDEDQGDVWFGTLAWSGSWQIAIEQNQEKQVRVTGGFNPFDFSYVLAPGESLQLPSFFGGFSHEGMGGASRLLHRFELAKILPQAPRPRPRPVLYDSWEATQFAVNEAGQEALAEKAASIGVERFVVDDGWFGQRDLDTAGLGDWYPNPTKFPHGLKPLIDKVHSLGMDFGLWVEPEMVNPNSDLYRQHPDWVLNFPGRPRTEARRQLVLNLARPDVHAYVLDFLDKLLNENDIALLKWDYNRNWSEPGWPAIAADAQKEVYVKFVESLYSILAELRKRHPHVEIEQCSGGGGRTDLGILRYTDQIWPSDDTDPFDRLSIQNGFTYPFTPAIMMAWVTDSPSGMDGRSTSLTYRFLSSMEASLSIGANLNKWTPEDFATAKTLVEQYKQIRSTVQMGSLYRLISPTHGSEYSATESVATDGSQATVFAYLHSTQFNHAFPRLQLRGLDSTANYRLHVLDGKAGPGTPESASGAYWMNAGMQLELRGDFQASLVTLERSAASGGN
jgi:alpha-galactosidase